jgi:hypothetical protein
MYFAFLTTKFLKIFCFKLQNTERKLLIFQKLLLFTRSLLLINRRRTIFTLPAKLKINF